MTNNEFNLGLIAEPTHTKDGKTRLRYLVADAIEKMAKELRKERPDKAARLQWIAGRLNSGQPPTKKVLNKCRKDIEIIRSRIVDNIYKEV